MQGEGKTASEKRLYLKVARIDSPLADAALRLCRAAEGEIPVVFYETASKRYLSAKDVSVLPVDALLTGLRDILGEENVVLR